jgi:hypothetical protein
MATAAVVAIAICAPLIVSDIQDMTQPVPTEGPGAIARTEAPERVMLASGGESQGITAVRPVRMESVRRTEQPAGRAAIAKLDTEGVQVPVDHAFYDAEESARWW